MLRKVVLGTGLVALVPVVGAAVPVDSEPKEALVMRPSDLPIYETPIRNAENIVSKQPKETFVHSILKVPVQTVRQSVQIVLAQTESVQKTIADNYHEFQDRSDWVVKYLREEDNKDVRYGAVAMGGLTGFIFGLRGGIIRRVFYAGIGTTVMGGVCFPEETKTLFKENSVLAKQYINIAYNFLYGVKPGDPQLELNFPELTFPKNFSEFVDLSVSMASSVKQAIMPPPSKETPQETAKADKKE